MNVVFFFLAILATPVSAQEARFRVEGEKLYFNSNVPYEDGSQGDLIERDREELGLILMETAEIKTIILQSEGGNGYVAMDMAAKIEEFGLATEVAHGCYSSCALIFLAGSPRTLRRGGVLGFHRAHISADIVQLFHERTTEPAVKNLKPAAVAYDYAIDSAVETAQYMRRRGVGQEFILQVLATPPAAMWEPSRLELKAAGVIE